MYSLSMERKCEAIYEILTPTITVRRYVLKPAAVHCCQTTLGFHFGCELKRQYPVSRGPFSKYLRWNEPCSRFDRARASLMWLRREPSVGSMTKKYPLEPRVKRQLILALNFWVSDLFYCLRHNSHFKRCSGWLAISTESSILLEQTVTFTFICTNFHFKRQIRCVYSYSAHVLNVILI